MSFLSSLAKVCGLENAGALKLRIKGVGYFLRDPLFRGVPLELGGVRIRVPARFARQPWTHYEKAATHLAAGWLLRHPDAVLIDVGSSVALYSLLALDRSPQGEAWAIDSEQIALQSSRWLCRHVGADRLHVIRGYAGDAPTVSLSAQDAAAQTLAALESGLVSREPSHASYICLDSQATTQIPVHAIDRLFGSTAPGRPHLVKIDVEGAEMLVLRGADAFIRRLKPQLLVSVHPPALAGFGLAPADIRRWLEDRGYSIEIHPEPHEEHWWCTPA